MNLERLGLAPDGEISGVLVPHDGLVDSGDGGLTSQRNGNLQHLLHGENPRAPWLQCELAPERNIKTKKQERRDSRDLCTLLDDDS